MWLLGSHRLITRLMLNKNTVLEIYADRLIITELVIGDWQWRCKLLLGKKAGGSTYTWFSGGSSKVCFWLQYDDEELYSDFRFCLVFIQIQVPIILESPIILYARTVERKTVFIFKFLPLNLQQSLKISSRSTNTK